jgi:hypothetical protein
MKPKRLRFGIRAQLTIIVLVAALLSTIATLYIANSAIQSYVIDQAKQRESQNLQIAKLVLQTEFGDNVSIDVNGNLVADSPLAASAAGLGQVNNINDFRPYPLNSDVDYVDEVQHFVGGEVAVYQCADERGDLLAGGCPRITTTILETKNGQLVRNLDDKLNEAAFQYTKSHSSPFVAEDTVSGVQYIAAYQAMYSPQHDFIGVLFVGEPLAGVQTLILHTTIQLAIVGGLIMVVGAIFAILLAQAITSTLQTAARQVSAASTKFSAIAAQQSSGSAQQVWAINAISQALHNLSETATDVARRSDQLAQMGIQVLQRRSEISPTQIDSIINYLTRSSHDISIQSSQQASTVERMNGAMQAVIEVAQQVARDSQQTTEGAERLEQVVLQLQQLVGTSDLTGAKAAAGKTNTGARNIESGREMSGSPGAVSTLAPTPPPPAIRSVRPSQAERSPASSPARPPFSSSPAGTQMPQPSNRPFLTSGTLGKTTPEEPMARPGQMRPPTRFSTSGDPGTFPSFEPGKNPFPGSGNTSPTYPSPRQDPRRRS